MVLARRSAVLGLALIASAVLLGLSVQRRAFMYQPLVVPAREQQPEKPPEVDFFASRNQVTLVVPRAMPVRELIETYQLEHSRDDVMRQLAAKTLQANVPAGTTITIQLTPKLPPVAGGQPGQPLRRQ